MNPATSAVSSLARGRARRCRLIYGTAVCLLAIVFFAALGSVAGLAAAGAGLVVFAAGQAVCGHRPRPAARRPAGQMAARRYPDTLTGRAGALGQDLAALGHEMRWGFDGGETASTFTGTCRRCGGQVTATRAAPMAAITVSWTGRPLLAHGRPPVLRRCGSR